MRLIVALAWVATASAAGATDPATVIPQTLSEYATKDLATQYLAHEPVFGAISLKQATGDNAAVRNYAMAREADSS